MGPPAVHTHSQAANWTGIAQPCSLRSTRLTLQLTHSLTNTYTRTCALFLYCSVSFVPLLPYFSLFFNLFISFLVLTWCRVSHRSISPSRFKLKVSLSNVSPRVVCLSSAGKAHCFAEVVAYIPHAGTRFFLCSFFSAHSVVSQCLRLSTLLLSSG